MLSDLIVVSVISILTLVLDLVALVFQEIIVPLLHMQRVLVFNIILDSLLMSLMKSMLSS